MERQDTGLWKKKLGVERPNPAYAMETSRQFAVACTGCPCDPYGTAYGNAEAVS